MQRTTTATSGVSELNAAAERAAKRLPFETTGTDGGPVLADGPQKTPKHPTSAQIPLPNLPSGPTGPVFGDSMASDALTPAQRLAVAAIVCGRTFSAAAAQAGVNRKTLYEWRKQTAFMDAVEHYSREALEATAMRARSLMLKSTRALAESLDERRRGDSRFGWACRMVNSRHLWTLAQTMPRREDAE